MDAGSSAAQSLADTYQTRWKAIGSPRRECISHVCKVPSDCFPFIELLVHPSALNEIGSNKRAERDKLFWNFGITKIKTKLGPL